MTQVPDNVRVVYGSPVMRFVPQRFIAMTLRNTIHVRHPYYLPPHILRHELVHVNQWAWYGVVGFLVRYLWQCARYGYRSAPLEIEARAAE